MRSHAFARLPLSTIALTLLLTAALSLGLGDTRAQATAVCSNTPGSGERIECIEDNTSTDDINIDAQGIDIDTTALREHGIHAFHEGEGDIDIDVGPSIASQTVTRSTIDTTGSGAFGVLARHDGTGDITVEVDTSTIKTLEEKGYGIHNWHEGTAGDANTYVRGLSFTSSGRYGNGLFGLISEGGRGDILIEIQEAEQRTTITTMGEDSLGIYAINQVADEGDIRIDATKATITTMGEESHGISAWKLGSGKVELDLSDVSITAVGDYALGIYTRNHLENSSPSETDLNIDMRDSTVITKGFRGIGIYAWNYGPNLLRVNLHNLIIRTEATALDDEGLTASHGIFAWNYNPDSGNTGNVHIEVREGQITTEGTSSHGIHARHYAPAGDNSGNLDIKMRASGITTRGPGSLGIFAWHTGTGDIDILVGGGGIYTSELAAHGILVYHSQGLGTIGILIQRGKVEASGENADGVRIGLLNTNDTDSVPDGTEEYVAEVGEDGYRQQTVRVNGQVFGGTGEAAGIFLAGGGKVFIGPQGTVGAASGIAIRAAGEAPKLLVDMNLGGRRVGEVIGDDYILNGGGETTIVVNGVKLHDGATGNTGSRAPNGAWDVSLREDGVTVDTSTTPWTISERQAGIIADRDFSAADFDEVPRPDPDEPQRENEPQEVKVKRKVVVEKYAPRASLYEILPDFLQRLTATRECFPSPDSPAQAQLSGGTGRYEPEASTAGAGYSFERFYAAGGLNLELGEEVDGRLSVHHVSSSATVSSPTGGGEIKVRGAGPALGLQWKDASDFYAAGCLSFTGYQVDLFSDKRYLLRAGVAGHGSSLGLEVGRQLALSERMRVTPRAWLAHTGVSIGSFTDAVNSRVSFPNSGRFSGGFGMMAETAHAWASGELSLRGSLGFERMFGGAETIAQVSGEELRSSSARSSMLLGLSGSYREGRFSLGTELSVGAALGSRTMEYSGLFYFSVRF